MHRKATLFCSLSLCILLGCGGGPASMDPKFPSEVASALKSAEGLELYSLDPTQRPASGAKAFQGWTILGKTTVTDPAVRDRLVTALNDGVKNHDGKVLFNFIPRHGVRLIPKSGQTINLVITFECFSMRAYIGGQKLEKEIRVSGTPEPVFDEVLRNAGVPLAAKPVR